MYTQRRLWKSKHIHTKLLNIVYKEVHDYLGICTKHPVRGLGAGVGG